MASISIRKDIQISDVTQKNTQKIVPNTACHGGIAHLCIWNVNYSRY
jgi:hypothetical protein